MVALADHIEAVEVLFETVREFVRDGRATAHLIVDGLSREEFDDAQGVFTGPRSKVERIGEHAIEYRLSEEVQL